MVPSTASIGMASRDDGRRRLRGQWIVVAMWGIEVGLAFRTGIGAFLGTKRDEVGTAENELKGLIHQKGLLCRPFCIAGAGFERIPATAYRFAEVRHLA